MFYVGLDIHSKHVTICVLDENGKLFRRAQVRTIQETLDVLGRLPDRFEVCYEASCGYGFYHDALRPLAARVVVAHPGHLRLIFRSKHKNDRQDAEKLAKLLYLGEVPAVHVPSVDVRSWRELITCRRHLIEKRTMAKNGLRALLRSVGVTPPRRPGLWTKAGTAWLRQLAWPTATQSLRRDLLLEEIDGLNRQVRRVEVELDRLADSHPAVFQLMSIPGVGVRTAEAVASFLDDPRRFPNSKTVGRYFGLVPSQDQSGGSNRMGHITKAGSATVRRFLTEAAWQSVRRSPTVRAYFERVRRDDPQRKKIAVVATAHYLARVMYALLRRGELWQESVAA
jgi:transposase